jgi:transcriptional regulator with XRE-family HTH domain
VGQPWPVEKDTALARFGLRLRGLREKAGFSQEELAERAQVHRTYLSGIERGRRNPSLINLLRIARALKLSISVLFEEV